MQMNYLKYRFHLILFMMLPVITACTMYDDIQYLRQAKYEIGEHKGAEYCATCHQEIYAQWLNSSRHAVATTAKSFNEFRQQFIGKYLFKTMMGEEMCYACHGSKEVNEGVNCETCHGLVLADRPIMETHKEKYSPGRVKLKQEDFCAKCHDMKNPMSGEYLMAIYSDWEKSEAATKGITCQDCHMQAREDEKRYHGFDTAVRKKGIYRDDLAVSDVSLEFPYLIMTIENRVTGHSIPAGGATRTLALEIFCRDADGKQICKKVQLFASKFELTPVLGLMPHKLIENTQLQSGEKRVLKISLPSTLRGKVNSVELLLRMYEVSDEYQGDIEKAYWVSEAIVDKKISFSDKQS